LNYFAQGAKLLPGAGIKNHQHLGVSQLGRLCINADRLDLALRVDERQIGRRGMRIDNADVLPQRFENAGHPQLAAQSVAIGPHVTGKQEPLVRLNDADELGPVDGVFHGVLNRSRTRESSGG
jgi:hypothetical protein